MNLLDVFKKHTPKVQGNGQIKMECPFRENHTGKYSVTSGDGSKSFFATPDINAYHCFSCGAKGRLTSLLTTKFEVPYFESVEMVNLVKYEREKRSWELDFMWELTPPKEFTERGIPESSLKKFRVGYDKKKQIVIPLYLGYDLKGIKFRIEEGERSFWYSDSFIKAEYLYNYNLERSLKAGYTILVEGETDVWRVDSFNYDVTGLLGVSLSDFQINLIRKIPLIYLCLDTDASGIRAMHQLYQKLKLLTEVMFINLPVKDPGACSYRQFYGAMKRPYNFAEFNYLTTE